MPKKSTVQRQRTMGIGGLNVEHRAEHSADGISFWFFLFACLYPQHVEARRYPEVDARKCNVRCGNGIQILRCTGLRSATI